MYLLLSTIITLFSGCGNSGSDDGDSKNDHGAVQKTQIELTPELAAGKATWDGSCKLCHEKGLAHAPKLGDKKAWDKRLTKGMDQLIKNAINGYNEMPPKGANPKLTDSEVEWAVRYMVESSQ